MAKRRIIEEPSSEDLRLLAEKAKTDQLKVTQSLQEAEVELEQAQGRLTAARRVFEDGLVACQVSEIVCHPCGRSVRTAEGFVIIMGYAWDYTVSPPKRYDLDSDGC